MNAVTAFTCSRIPPTVRKSERSKAIRACPVRSGSKNGSPAGTSISAPSRGSMTGTRSMSWSRNCPHCHTKLVTPSGPGTEPVCATHRLLISRALARARRAGADTPSS